MREKIITIIVSVIEIITIKYWFVCSSMRSMMDISSVNTKLQLEDYIHNDTGTSMLIIRLFHNKIIGFLINVFGKYLKYWDIRFMSNAFSLVGVFGIIVGLWKLGTAKINLSLKLVLFGIVLLWPLPFALHKVPLSFMPYFLLLSAPYYLLSLFGLWKYMVENKKYGYIVVIVLALLSIWWFLLLPREIDYFCGK